MKRIGNLFDQIIALDNLRLADEKARKGKMRSYGVMVHDKNRETNLLALHESLKMVHSKHRNITYLQFTNPRNVKFTGCLISPTVSCTMQ